MNVNKQRFHQHRTRQCAGWSLVVTALPLLSGACGADSDGSSENDAMAAIDTTEPLDLGPLGITSSALSMGIGTPVQETCEGETSGGGQRVRGIVRLELAEWTNTTHTWWVTVEAENWKRNFGWNLKRTAELSVNGTISLRSEFSPVGQPFEVSLDTGGDLETRIGATYAFDPIPAGAEPIVTGSLTFHGRHGTECSL